MNLGDLLWKSKLRVRISLYSRYINENFPFQFVPLINLYTLIQEGGFEASNTDKLKKLCDPNTPLSVSVHPGTEGEVISVSILLGNNVLRNHVQVRLGFCQLTLLTLNYLPYYTILECVEKSIFDPTKL